jgi:hypothetical protein
VIAYWQGVDSLDTTRSFNGTVVTGEAIGRTTQTGVVKATFRADVTGLNLVGYGLNHITVERSGAGTGVADAAFLVVVNDGSLPGRIEARDGRDIGTNGVASSNGDITIPQTFMLPAANYRRRVELLVLASTENGDAPVHISTVTGGIRTSSIYQITSQGVGLGDGLALIPVTVTIPSSVAPGVKMRRRQIAKLPPVMVTVQVAVPGTSVLPAAGSSQLAAGGQCNAGAALPADGTAGVDGVPTLHVIGNHGVFNISANRSGIGDFVWLDGNCDGRQDPTEAGVAEVRVELYSCPQTFLGFTETDDAGFYEFRGLAPGCYRVRFVLPSGYTFSPTNATGNHGTDSDAKQNNGVTEQTMLDNLELDFTWDAGLCANTPQPASLGDFVWNDLNADGIQDLGEPGIPGVTVNLTDCSDVVLDTQLTGAAGDYLFSNLAPGCYRVEFVNPGGGYVFSPKDQGANDAVDSDADTTTGRTGDYNLVAGQTDLTADAGLNVPPPPTACLGDFLWNDLNANGIQEAGEPGIAGQTVDLLDCSGNVLGSTVTDATGIYGFCNLTAGGYAVGFHAPAGSVFSPQDQGLNDAVDSDANTTTGVTGCVVLAPGETNLTIDAGVNSPPPPGGFRTQTMGGWGNKCHGNNPGCYRDANFPSCFPTGAQIGTAAGPHAVWTTAKAVEDYLPAGSTAGTLVTNLVNPLTTQAGVLGGQTLALTLSVGFDACDPSFGSSPFPLSALKVIKAGDPCFGMTVAQVLAEANAVLSGGGTFSPSTIQGCVASINENYVDGSQNHGYLGF